MVMSAVKLSSGLTIPKEVDHTMLGPRHSLGSQIRTMQRRQSAPAEEPNFPNFLEEAGIGERETGLSLFDDNPGGSEDINGQLMKNGHEIEEAVE